MDPILGGQVAAEIRTVERERPAKAVPFRYNKARAQIKAAGELLGRVKKEARGKLLLSPVQWSAEEVALVAQVKALRAEYRLETTTDVRRAEIGTILRNNRTQYRRIVRSGNYAPASKGAELVIPFMKAEMQAMYWAWAIARATECDSGENTDPSIQKTPLVNGKWARLKLPTTRSLRNECGTQPTDIDDFRAWAGDVQLREPHADGGAVSDFSVSVDAIENYLQSWAITPKTERDGLQDVIGG